MDEPTEDFKKQAEEYLASWQRERADFANYKKDEIRRLGEFIKFANAGLIEEIIEVLDDLEIVIKNNKNSEGLGQIMKKFQDLLAKHGVEKIKMGDKFDPHLHEAVDSEEGGEKIEEVRAGYVLGDKVIRPSRVKIIK